MHVVSTLYSLFYYVFCRPFPKDIRTQMAEDSTKEFRLHSVWRNDSPSYSGMHSDKISAPSSPEA